MKPTKLKKKLTIVITLMMLVIQFDFVDAIASDENFDDDSSLSTIAATPSFTNDGIKYTF